MFEGLEAFVEPIRDRRKEVEKDMERLIEVIKGGDQRARSIALKTIEEVREKNKVG